jgi:hypothetical protein
MLFPDAFAAALSDRTTALAAAFIIATRHPEILRWAARTVCGDAPGDIGPPKPRARGASPRPRKPNGGARKSPDKDAYLGRRREARDADDQALVNVMRSNREGSINDWATTIGKSRTSCVSGLHRLRAAGLAESVEGRWKLTEEPAPREPAPRWVKPPSAVREHAHA